MNEKCKHCGYPVLDRHECLGTLRARVEEIKSALNEVGKKYQAVIDGRDALKSKLEAAEKRETELRKRVDELEHDSKVIVGSDYLRIKQREKAYGEALRMLCSAMKNREYFCGGDFACDDCYVKAALCGKDCDVCC